MLLEVWLATLAMSVHALLSPRSVLRLRELHPVQAEMDATQQIKLSAYQQNIAEDTLNLLLHRRHKIGNGAVIRTIAAAERHEEDVFATYPFDLSQTDHPPGISEQDHFEQNPGVDRRRTVSSF